MIGILAALLESRLAARARWSTPRSSTAPRTSTRWPPAFLAGGVLREERAANLLDGGAPFYDLYETADGRHLAIGALEPQFYDELVAGLGIADTAPDRNDPAQPPTSSARLIADAVRGRTQAEWVEVFDGTDACVAPVLPMTEAFAPSAPRGARHVRRARRNDPAGSGPALLADGAVV